MDLQVTWFILLGVLLTGYAILDGFDLGVGILHLFAKNEEERQINVSSIGPFWDGNEVWLLTGGGAMFAAFPIVYATVFSGFYLAFMLLLVALIFRAVSLEFRGQMESPSWRRFWDIAFGLGSVVPALLYGVAFGNILRGIPISENMMFTGDFPGLLNPFALLVGLLTLVLFTMHGALFLTLKTDGEYFDRLMKWASGSWIAVVILYVITTGYAIFSSSFLFENASSNPLFWIMLLLMVASLIYIPVAAKAGKLLHGFISSGVLIASMMALSGISLFPRLVPSITNLDYSLTIRNASSTAPTLTAMLVIALTGMPIVIGYTIYIYWIFRGKTVITKKHY